MCFHMWQRSNTRWGGWRVVVLFRNTQERNRAKQCSGLVPFNRRLEIRKGVTWEKGTQLHAWRILEPRKPFKGHGSFKGPGRFRAQGSPKRTGGHFKGPGGPLKGPAHAHALKSLNGPRGPYRAQAFTAPKGPLEEPKEPLKDSKIPYDHMRWSYTV